MKTSIIRAGILGMGVAALWKVVRARERFSFSGRVVVITGGSRGLGLVLARKFLAEGARIALLARSEADLQRAVEELQGGGGDVLGVPCDVREQAQVNNAMERIAAHFGAVDVVVNNAGIIQVGPLEHMQVEDFEQAMAVHFFGPLFTTLAALPHLRKQGGGRIVNIASIGGKIAFPHLLPYNASKFALVGLSDGLRHELRQENIYVTTVCPGLMRTGSPRNAEFKGQHRREYAWFAISDSLPLLTISAERAADKIINAARAGDARLLLGIQTKTAVLVSELCPELASRGFALVNRLLPAENRESGNGKQTGWQSESSWAPSVLTRLTDQAAVRNNERG